ncbi:LLM class F420-dependent oxidoreductase [Mycolicibacterium sp. CH28]|uniref:LLM class F420-dependent oxidoreductase n=1 Tax=Mycolicibacterium sp. CH28 TaxID=2512237 RepID=UPI001080773E|nr:LLM class F420-dependent oxidoreductase [Mycolicibacterium sp. CH28]TGD84315.1 LLM class F420-dependent oxidoreductase [Mycolicibacterium sp. CH28]
MQLGIHFIDFLPGAPEKLGPTLAAAARTADQMGASMFTMADHFFQMEAVGRAQDPFLEGYTSLGFLAGQTERIDLSLLVTGVTYRHPGVLAKIVTTLDILSQGRAMLGMGAAWYEREHLAMGVPYPPLAQRFEMLEEALQICEQMWSDDDGPYQGRHYQLAETICSPQPIRRPPILIGGDGEKKTLRLVAEHGDVWNSMTQTPVDFRQKYAVLQRHCDAVGRNPADIRTTVSIGPQFDPFADTAAFLREMENFAAAGAELANMGPLPGNSDPVGFIARLGDEIAPRLASIG